MEELVHQDVLLAVVVSLVHTNNHPPHNHVYICTDHVDSTRSDRTSHKCPLKKKIKKRSTVMIIKEVIYLPPSGPPPGWNPGSGSGGGGGGGSGSHVNPSPTNPCLHLHLPRGQ